MTLATMELESSVLDMLQKVGIRKGQTILDFGCGYGMYTIPIAKIAGNQGKVYALDKDKEALDALMRKTESEGLKNLDKMETTGELGIELNDESVDAVLLFEVFHPFYFPRAEDRRMLLDEIYRIMKPSAFLSVSIWPNLVEEEMRYEIENAHFRLAKEVCEIPADYKSIKTCRFLNFRKV